MKKLLEQWIIDAEAFELMAQYNVDCLQNYNFVNRQGDFYITLINEMYNILQHVESINYCAFKDELHSIAQGMLVYSDHASEGHFSCIDKISNQLYVAVIYFLTGYEAVASYILRTFRLWNFETESSKLMYYIVSGGSATISDFADDQTRSMARMIREYILYGKNSINIFQNIIERKFETFVFSSIDDFFDTAILVHVARKFSSSNLRITLYEADTSTNWDEYIRCSANRHILSFLPSQIDAIDKGLLKFHHAFSLKMPTSGGKSFITELVIYQEIQHNSNAKILYLAPLRSLSRELKENFEDISRKLGFTSRAIYGGSTFTIDQNMIDEANLLIATPETFTTLEDTMEEQLARFSLVICDEGQLLDSLNRGINYELLLTRLKKIEGIRFLFLSAIIPNIEDVNTWLGGNKDEVGSSTYRPCPIKLAIVKHQQNNGLALSVKDSDYNSEKFRIENFVNAEEIRQLPNTSTIKSLAAILAIKSVVAGQTLIYTCAKSGNMGCVAIGNEIESVLNTNVFPDLIKKTSSTDRLHCIAKYLKYQLGDDHPLGKFIEKGFGYHHGSLPQNIREIIELNYSKNIIPLLICTNTLAEGVNLPIHTLIPYNISRFNYSMERMEVLDVTELKNILGRVGRAGKQQFGVIIVPNENEKASTYSNIVKALQNRGLNNIMGTLYDVVRVFQNLTDRIDDEKINDILEHYGLAAAIDTMITRSMKTQSLKDIDLEEIVRESLAYHVGTEGTRTNLRRVFRIRKEKIEKVISAEKYNLLHNTGLTVRDVLKAEEMINEKDIASFVIQNPIEPEWISYIVSVVTVMPSYDHPEVKTYFDTKLRPIKNNEMEIVIMNWISGMQYYEIAESIKCEVDNILDVISNIQSKFYSVASSIVRYIDEKFNINIDSLRVWIDMLKYGVNSKDKLSLIKCGVTDRIIVNIFPDKTVGLNLDYENAYKLRSSIYGNKLNINTIVEALPIPQISKEQIYNL